MKFKLLLVTIVLSNLLLSCSKNKNSQEFILSGELSGFNTQQVILTYSNIDNLEIKDTIPVSNGQFRTKGYINGPTIVFLSGNIKKRGTSDPNYVSFFIESNKMSIKLIEDKFKEAKITGSGTQEEYEKVSKLVYPLYSELKTINIEIKELLSQRKKNKNIDQIDKQLTKLKGDYYNKRKEIDDLRLNYITEHQNSYLSSYYLNFYCRKIPFELSTKYFDALSPKIQKSKYANEALAKIKLIKGSMKGSNAPIINTIDSNGNSLTLDSYKGKYVLLDFWAGWCVPCIEGLPKLKELYNAYNSKGFEIIGLSSDINIENWKKALEKHELSNWRQIYVGKDDTNGDDIFKSFNVKALPGFILINKQGVIEGRYAGADNSNELEFDNLKRKLEKIFK